MVTIAIAGTTVPADNANEGWINQMIASNRREGTLPDVRVSINTGDVQVGLVTPGCGGARRCMLTSRARLN
jgi:hypothetical protein